MPAHHEDAEQKAVFDWAAYYPALRWMHAIPNGGRRDKREAARLRGQGVKPGVSDIFLPLPMGLCHGLYIEMKRRKQDGRSGLTKEQQDFRAAMLGAGYDHSVCYGAEEAIQTIKEYASL